MLSEVRLLYYSRGVIVSSGAILILMVGLNVSDGLSISFSSSRSPK